MDDGGLGCEHDEHCHLRDNSFKEKLWCLCVKERVVSFDQVFSRKMREGNLCVNHCGELVKYACREYLNHIYCKLLLWIYIFVQFHVLHI